MKNQEKLPKYRVFAEAPTVYQSNSIKMFGLTDQGRDGLLRFDYFDSEEEAVNYLLRCVDLYSVQNGTEDEINELRDQCRMGHLTLDAVTAFVQVAKYHSQDPEDVIWN